MSELITLGFFFAMRSCEFSEASSERKTLAIVVGGIRFFRKDNATTHHSSREIFAACRMHVALMLWKSEHGNNIVSQENIGDRQLNPIALSASIV